MIKKTKKRTKIPSIYKYRKDESQWEHGVTKRKTKKN